MAWNKMHPCHFKLNKLKLFVVTFVFTFCHQFQVRGDYFHSICSGVQVVGTELPHHYKARTDFKKLGQLRKTATEVAEEEMKGLEPHTVYIQCFLIRTTCFLLLHNQKIPLKCIFCPKMQFS